MKVICTNPKLTPEILAELAALDAMSDDDIDTSDIPEVTDWSNWTRGKFYRPVKKQVTLRIDADVIDWFKAQQGGARGYQTKINAALRKVVDGAKQRSLSGE